MGKKKENKIIENIRAYTIKLNPKEFEIRYNLKNSKIQLHQQNLLFISDKRGEWFLAVGRNTANSRFMLILDDYDAIFKTDFRELNLLLRLILISTINSKSQYFLECLYKYIKSDMFQFVRFSSIS